MPSHLDISSLIPKLPEPTIYQLPELRNLRAENSRENYASAFHQRLEEWINGFDESLDDKHEVGIRLVSFGQTVVFHLEDLGYWNPSLISFRGKTDEGQPVELIQHVSQISVLLMKLPRRDPSKPKRRQWVSLKHLAVDFGSHLAILKASCLTAQKYARAIPTSSPTGSSKKPPDKYQSTIRTKPKQSLSIQPKIPTPSR